MGKHLTTCFDDPPVCQSRTWIQGKTQGDRMHHQIYQNFCENYLKDGISEEQACLDRPQVHVKRRQHPS